MQGLWDDQPTEPAEDEAEAHVLQVIRERRAFSEHVVDALGSQGAIDSARAIAATALLASVYDFIQARPEVFGCSQKMKCQASGGFWAIAAVLCCDESDSEGHADELVRQYEKVLTRRHSLGATEELRGAKWAHFRSLCAQAGRAVSDEVAARVSRALSILDPDGERPSERAAPPRPSKARQAKALDDVRSGVKAAATSASRGEALYAQLGLVAEKDTPAARELLQSLGNEYATDADAWATCLAGLCQMDPFRPCNLKAGLSRMVDVLGEDRTRRIAAHVYQGAPRPLPPRVFGGRRLSVVENKMHARRDTLRLVGVSLGATKKKDTMCQPAQLKIPPSIRSKSHVANHRLPIELALLRAYVVDGECPPERIMRKYRRATMRTTVAEAAAAYAHATRRALLEFAQTHDRVLRAEAGLAFESHLDRVGDNRQLEHLVWYWRPSRFGGSAETGESELPDASALVPERVFGFSSDPREEAPVCVASLATKLSRMCNSNPPSAFAKRAWAIVRDGSFGQAHGDVYWHSMPQTSGCAFVRALAAVVASFDAR